jgi:hypothetical protein
MSPQPGETLLHYRLVDKIGEGGMGAAWKAAADDDVGHEIGGVAQQLEGGPQATGVKRMADAGMDVATLLNLEPDRFWSGTAR